MYLKRMIHSPKTGAKKIFNNEDVTRILMWFPCALAHSVFQV
ncbi:hypothetical protein SJDPG11_01500 [Porphyromonas gingivalis SJD11]|nr:hypothetical protein SJDPG11_01500 [Porphyromonas gingivalis SJD11]